MQWIDVSLEQPQVAGKYLVKTRTTMGNTHKLESGYTITNGKGHFNVSNQIVTHWLKEDDKDCIVLSISDIDDRINLITNHLEIVKDNQMYNYSLSQSLSLLNEIKATGLKKGE
jgi:hypothetical protein